MNASLAVAPCTLLHAGPRRRFTQLPLPAINATGFTFRREVSALTELFCIRMIGDNQAGRELLFRREHRLSNE